MTTPETYLGAARAERFTNPMLSPGTHDFGDPPAPGAERIRLPGPLADRAGLRHRRGWPALELDFGARRVYLVLGSDDGRPRRMAVLLDGQPDPRRLAGGRHGGVGGGRRARLYDLVDLPGVERHELTLVPEAGVSGYAFTFG